jgi:putative two-component system response regulator
VAVEMLVDQPRLWGAGPGPILQYPATDVTLSTSGVRPRVMVVDDCPASRALIDACLTGVECDVRLASDGYTAIKAMEAAVPDLVLLEVEMQGLDGYQVCRLIKADPRLRLVPVVMITTLNQTEDRVKALDSGADDFMSKPVERVELVARVTSALRLKRVYDKLDSAEQVIFALSAALEAKDFHTERHTHRVALSARNLGERLGLNQLELDALHLGGMIHDIGKIGIDDSILRKPGPLDPDEQVKMRAHPVIGVQIVRPLHSVSATLPIIRHHHEWFNGRGYPDGLCGPEIPVAARIVAICDAYDSLVNDRPYRTSRSPEEAIRILTGGAGRQWDPRLVSLFIAELPAIRGLNAA